MATRVQAKSRTDDAAAASQALAFDNPTASGNSIRVLVALYQAAGSGGVTWTCTDNYGNTYSLDIQEQPYGSVTPFNAVIFSANNITAGAGHTITLTNVTGGLTSYFSLTIIEYSGMANAARADISGQSITTTTPGAAVTLSAAGTVLAVIYYETAGGITPSAGWSQVAEDETSQWSVIEKMGGAAVYTPGWTLPNGGYSHVASAAYLDGAGGGGGGGSNLSVQLYEPVDEVVF